jgi:glucose/arabinose dehydrogenase
MFHPRRLYAAQTRMPVTRKPLRTLCFALALVLAACGGGDDGPPPLPDGSFALRLQPVGTALGLDFPLFVTAPPGDNTRLFVVEKGGVIKIVVLATEQVLSTPFISITVNAAGEGGLLGLAFHPNYSLNGFFYVYIINAAGDTEIRRYTRSSTDPNVADPASVQLVLSVDQPAGLTNHKAGWLGFGLDGFLYAALGDGGGGGDPGENAENLNSLLGKMLRLDINAPDAFPSDPLKNYAIPGTNPFAGPIPGFDEIWSYGLRNPFRNSFDRLTGDFYIADVGQGRQEEVNVSTFASGAGAGINFGWDIMEGSLCFEPMMNCSTSDLALPILEYDHSQGCSITGGYVYRGLAIPALQGTYFYGDFCQGFVRSFRFVNGVATEQADWVTLRPGGNITSFGEDAAGELYIVTSAGGLFRIVQ